MISPCTVIHESGLWKCVFVRLSEEKLKTLCEERSSKNTTLCCPAPAVSNLLIYLGEKVADLEILTTPDVARLIKKYNI